MVDYVIGVDGGTTKTIALVADTEGHILGAARGEGTNWVQEDVTVPMTAVTAIVRQALEHAGKRGDEIALAALGLAGADWPDDHTRREDFLRAQGLARRLIVKNDSFVGLRAGTRHPYGVVIAAGTGPNCGVIAPDGREWAYGYYANYGGAGDIAQEGLQAVWHEEDGRGAPTALTPLILERLGLPTAEALMRAMVAGTVPRNKILALCPLVFETADAGDEVAAGIIAHHGRALAEYATNLIRRYGMAKMEFDVVLSGSVFKGQGPLLVDTITQEVHRVAPRAHITRVEFEPAVGGVLLAYDALQLAISDAMYTNLAHTVPPPAFFSTVDGGQLTQPLRRRSRTP